MNSLPLQVERRVGHRFPFQVPVSLREVASGAEGPGLTQDLSSRGAFVFTDILLTEGAEVELTLNMPSEITLGQSMRVRCRGRILRVMRATAHGLSDGRAQSENPVPPDSAVPAEGKIGVAVCLQGYEYLPEVADSSSSSFERISALHDHHEHEEDRPSPPTEVLARP